jgi:predicted SnoaL-like aldol condensation-catalyzing enzyme
MKPLQIWKLFVACTMGAGLAMSAHAATYTPQEEANVKLVADFYAALDNANAHGDMNQKMRSIAEKYLAADYIQHMEAAKKFGPGREGFIRMFEGMQMPPAGKAAPAGMPPMGSMPVLPPAQVLSLIANGDIVIRVSSRTMPAAPGAEANPSYIFNMFRIQNGKLAEHWDASSGAAMGSPPPAPTPAH